MTSASAPAKLILCGEHAVVYGRPAIALPLADIRAWTTLQSGVPGGGLYFEAPDITDSWRSDERPDEPLSDLVRRLLDRYGVSGADLTITLRSQIPIASGMGSGAAIATALVRAFAAHYGEDLDAATLAALVYDSERRYHGTPSGIDNTVVAYEQAIWFQRRLPDGGWWEASGPSIAGAGPQILPLTIGCPLTLVIGDSGIRSATRLPVGAVRERQAADPERYHRLFDAVGQVVVAARAALAGSDYAGLGQLLDANQELLEQMGVSSAELERLIVAARRGGALGAKLSGAGWGGVMLALAPPGAAEPIVSALIEAGAARVQIATVPAQTPEV
jgi:mevalonate kinase